MNCSLVSLLCLNMLTIFRSTNFVWPSLSLEANSQCCQIYNVFGYMTLLVDSQFVYLLNFATKTIMWCILWKRVKNFCKPVGQTQKYLCWGFPSLLGKIKGKNSRVAKNGCKIKKPSFQTIMLSLRWTVWSIRGIYIVLTTFLLYDVQHTSVPVVLNTCSIRCKIYIVFCTFFNNPSKIKFDKKI